MSDLEILYTKIISDKDMELNLQEEALNDEYAYKPYIDERVPMVDFGCVELQKLEEKESINKTYPPSNPNQPGGGKPTIMPKP